MERRVRAPAEADEASVPRRRVCGKQSAVTSQPYLAWPHPEYYDVRVCLASCSETSSSSLMKISYSRCGADVRALLLY